MLIHLRDMVFFEGSGYEHHCQRSPLISIHQDAKVILKIRGGFNIVWSINNPY